MSSTTDRAAGPDEVYCRHCGSVIAERAEICPECGVRQYSPGLTGPGTGAGDALDDALEGGNPFVAALLSAILPGLGQIYNREITRGIVLIGVTIAAAFSSLFLVGFLLFPIVWLFAIYDAYTRADRGVAPASRPPTTGSYARPEHFETEREPATTTEERGSTSRDESRKARDE